MIYSLHLHSNAIIMNIIMKIKYLDRRKKKHNIESRWTQILAICSIEIQCVLNIDITLRRTRHIKLNLAPRILAIGKTLALWRTVLFFNGLFEPFWGEGEYSLAGLLVSDIHNTRHPPRHSMLSPREILFSFRKYKAHRPRSLLSCIDFISSPDSRLLSFLLTLHNSTLCRRSLKGTVSLLPSPLCFPASQTLLRSFFSRLFSNHTIAL